jgi:hypothetical protein
MYKTRFIVPFLLFSGMLVLAHRVANLLLISDSPACSISMAAITSGFAFSPYHQDDLYP